MSLRRVALAVVALIVHAAPAHAAGTRTARVRLAAAVGGPGIPVSFPGLSVEWTLVDRYMGRQARPVFAHLLRNIGHGVLRIGGASQDTFPFAVAAPDTEAVVTPADLAAVRAALDGAPGWTAILGTTMAPPGPARPWASAAEAAAFVAQGVAPAFAGDEATVAGIELGNEPDLTYPAANAYVADFAAYAGAQVSAPFPLVAPSTSEPIAPWRSIAARSVPTKFFWDWDGILDSAAPALAPGAVVTDHFYPTTRGCSSGSYWCATIPALLSGERMRNLDYLVFRHAAAASQHGLGYRLDELNSAAHRGVAGVSDVAAAALWALSAMFHAACPQPPDRPGANADCALGAVGVNFHNAEARVFLHPEEGNAHYNAIDYDAASPAGAPTAAPEYYALLLFGRFAAGATSLRPLGVTGGSGVTAWQLGAHRAFLLNPTPRRVVVSMDAPGSAYAIDRMTPHDPAHAGRTLDAPQVRVDGRKVAADGRWPGFRPGRGRIVRRHLRFGLRAGEAAAVTVGAAP